MTNPTPTDAELSNVTAEVATDMPPESSEHWAARMHYEYGECPDDLPNRAPGQSDAEWRAIAEEHMRAAKAAAQTAAQPPADAPSGDPAPDDPPAAAEPVSGDPVAETSTPAAESEPAVEAQPVDQSTPGDDGDQLTRPERQAAQYRQRLRDAEAAMAAAQEQHVHEVAAITAERDAAADLLARTRQSIIDTELQRTGLAGKLLTAAGHTVDTLIGDDGLIDRDALTAAIENTIDEFNVDIPDRPRRPDPIPSLGIGNGYVSGPSDSARFSAAFRPKSYNGG